MVEQLPAPPRGRLEHALPQEAPVALADEGHRGPARAADVAEERRAGRSPVVGRPIAEPPDLRGPARLADPGRGQVEQDVDGRRLARRVVTGCRPAGGFPGRRGGRPGSRPSPGVPSAPCPDRPRSGRRAASSGSSRPGPPRPDATQRACHEGIGSRVATATVSVAGAAGFAAARARLFVAGFDAGTVACLDGPLGHPIPLASPSGGHRAPSGAPAAPPEPPAPGRS